VIQLNKRKRKLKMKIENDLAILPSYDTPPRNPSELEDNDLINCPFPCPSQPLHINNNKAADDD